MNSIQNVYDKYAYIYDKQNTMMEHLFSKGRKIFKLLRGNILEIGVGTGNNLPFYHFSTNVTGLDFSKNMIQEARIKVKKLALKHISDLVQGDIQELSTYFEPASFDYITSTCVLCSVPNPLKGLQEVKKVLKSTGRFIQIEHGVSKFKLINLILKGLDPITTKLRGFHLSRDHIKNLEIAGFKIIKHWSLDPMGIVKVIISKPMHID